MKAFFNKYKMPCSAVLAVAVLYALLFALGITCPIKYVTGISCPGCGMSRACFSALRLDFEAAFSYHPLWILLLPFAVALILLRVKKKRLALRICVFAGAVLMLVVFIWRLFTCTNGVVVAQPQNGLIGRIIQKLWG